VRYNRKALLTVSRLLQQEWEKNTLDDIQRLVDRHDGVQDLIHAVAETDGSTAPTIDHIKTNMDVRRDFSDDIEEATRLYNIALCRTIAPAMYATLPRELRDMVYEYLTPSRLDIDTMQSYNRADITSVLGKDLKFRLYFASRPRSHDDELCPEHYWREHIISCGVAGELMKAWYRNSTFKMNVYWSQQGSRTESLEMLLNNDRFSTGLQPRDLITKFAFEVRLHPRSDNFWRRNVLAAVDDLFLLKKATRIQINVSNISSEDKIGQLREFLIFIRPSILRLRESGYRCKVAVTDRQAKLDSWDAEEWEQVFAAETERGDSMVLNEA
jgi:hypothetical protein